LQEIRCRGRQVANRNSRKLLAVITHHHAECRFAGRIAFSSIASNTGARLPGEELMTCNTSAVAAAVHASRVSVMSRAFDAMTACA
jgi:hypothetical protein